MTAPTIKRINAGKGHRYTIDGKPVVGVTTALKAIDKPALVSWSARTVAEFAADNIDDLIGRMHAAGGRGPLVDYLKAIPWQRANTAAVRGTEIHAIAEKIHAGDEFEVADHLVGYVDSYVRFLEDFNPTPLHTELVIASTDPAYAGTLDAVMDFPVTAEGLVDIKTGSGVYGEFALQLAAYRYAGWMLVPEWDEPEPMVPVDFCGVIHVQPEDTQLIQVRVDESAFAAFKAAHYLYTQELKKDSRTRRSTLDFRIGEQMRPGAA